MTDNLVKWLRSGGVAEMDKVADHIEKLKEQKNIYSDAFTKAISRIKELEDVLSIMVEYRPVTVEDLKRARRVLEAKMTYYEAGFRKMADDWQERRTAEAPMEWTENYGQGSEPWLKENEE